MRVHAAFVLRLSKAPESSAACRLATLTVIDYRLDLLNQWRWHVSMFEFLRQLYWRMKYRPGRKVTFCCAFDGFSEILVVENRLATTGTLVYRERAVNVFGTEQDEFGPIHEDTVPDMVRRLTTLAED